jgi:hypothetical protein
MLLVRIEMQHFLDNAGKGGLRREFTMPALSIQEPRFAEFFAIVIE